MNVILYSEDNFIWTSMQEIIPGLVDCWKEVSKRRGEEVLLLNLDADDLKSHMPSLLKCQNLIVTSFNIKISNAVVLIREKLGVDARIHFHLHGLASVGCWPLFEFGIGRLLKKSDVFYSTCKRDAVAFKLTFENARCEIVPFHSLTIKSSNRVKSDVTTLVYVGRLAEQKNLHQLLWVCALVNKEHSNLKYRLKLFGKGDDLGSPNMDIPPIDYLNFLKKEIEDLNLKNVSLEGFVERNKLDQWIIENEHVFISPSLHSDENFGMAALKSLMAGSTAILSDWGGHTDFKSEFKNAVSLISVKEGSYGPCLDPLELKNAIVDKLENYSINTISTDNYTFETVVSKYEEILSQQDRGSSEDLMRSTLSFDVQSKRNKLIGKRQCHCFESYSDEMAQDFFRAYGMSDQIVRSEISGELAPWVKDSGFVDPHKGKVENIKRNELLTNGWVY
ncbi:MAG: glycosyltransferase [Deltaproteobacteria bacterium]|nr:MAG: glycosyltransferase [Deltaproteobacteria bacterium]